MYTILQKFVWSFRDGGRDNRTRARKEEAFVETIYDEQYQIIENKGFEESGS